MTMLIRLSSLALSGAALLTAVSLTAQTAEPAPSAPAPAVAAAPADGLPEGPGKATLLRVCSGCHAPDVVTMQRRSEKDWHDLVEMMAGNGAQGSDADFAEITAYLARSFPAN